jgi:hypothetical protein
MAEGDEHRGGAPRLLPDVPIGAPGCDDGGLLWGGLAQLAERIDGLVEADEGRTPILVTGSWGSGKTTVLRQLQRRRAARPRSAGAAAAGPPTVWFEAWQHSGQGQLLPALCWTIWQHAPKQRRDDDRDKAELNRVLQLAGTVALGFATTLAGAAATLGGVGWMGTLIGAASPAAVGSATRGLKVEDKQQAPTRPPLVALHDALDRLLRFGWADPGERSIPRDREPVIIIDDLDRCPPDEALALLDQLRTLVSWGERLPCRLVLAVDRAVLHQAVRHRFRGLEDYDGNRYLEKVFPLTFAIGSPGKQEVARLVKAQVEWMVAENPGRWEAAATKSWLGALATALGHADFHNPRLINRVVSRFFLFMDWDGGEGVEAGVLAAWMAAGERWPRLRELTLLYDNDDWDIFSAIIRNDGNSRPEALAAPGDALLREKGARAWCRLYCSAGSSRAPFIEIDARLRALGL